MSNGVKEKKSFVFVYIFTLNLNIPNRVSADFLCFYPHLQKLCSKHYSRKKY